MKHYITVKIKNSKHIISRFYRILYGEENLLQTDKPLLVHRDPGYTMAET